MTLPSFNRFAFSSDPVSRQEMEAFQTFLEEMIEPLLNYPGNDIRILPEIDFNLGLQQEIRHGLGRKPIGWRAIKKDEDRRTWNYKEPDDQFLYLQAFSGHKLVIEVF